LLGDIADDLEGEETSKKRGASGFVARNEDPHNVSYQIFEVTFKLVLGGLPFALLSPKLRLLA
jgi:hypothetical protein